MNIDIREVGNNKWLHIAHMLMYLGAIGYGVMSIFENGTTNIAKYIAVIAVFLLFFFVEMISRRKGKSYLLDMKFGKFYYFLRLVLDMVLYFLTPTAAQGWLFLVLMVVFAVEIVFFVAFDEGEKRLMYYLLFAVSYGVVSIVLTIRLVYEKQISVPECLCEVFGSIAVIFVVVAIAEILAGIWDSFIKNLLAQNRAMEELNRANDSLKEYQDRIAKTNETLGVQKIELQSANKKINRAHDEMSVQNEISSAIVANSDKEVLMQKAAEILQVRLDLDCVAIILEEDNSLLVPGEEPKGRFVAMSTNLDGDFEKNLLDSIQKTDLKELLTMSKTYIQNAKTDTVKIFKYLTEEQELPSVIYLPLHHQEERMGTLCIGRKKEDGFVEGRAFYETIARQISIGISSAKLYEKMNDMAIRDGLTRIYNRRHLTDLLNGYISEAIGRKIPLTLALFDIDKFKSVNDTYGHQCGDAVIQYVATVLNRGALSHGGIAGRYGGEEFVIAFLNKGLDEGYEIVKEVHEAIKSAPVRYEDKVVDVRASAGIASFPATCSNPGELLTRSDGAMYYSKRHGRDQITIDSEKTQDQI